MNGIWTDLDLFMSRKKYFWQFHIFPHYKKGLFPLFSIPLAHPLIWLKLINKNLMVNSMSKNTEFAQSLHRVHRYSIKQDGVALLITHPSLTSYTTLSSQKRKKECDMWYFTRDAWHMTHDTWNVKCDTWQVKGRESFLKISAPWLSRFGSEGVLKIGRERVTDWLN